MPVGNISSQYELDWDIAQSSQNIAGNTSSVYGRLIIRKKSGSGYWSNTACSWNVNINGAVYSGTFTYDFRNYGELTLWSGNVTVTHNDDGTKTINSSGYANMNSPSGNATVGRTLTLTTIPRASTPSMAAPTTGSAVTINIARATSGFTHTVKYQFGDFSGTIGTGVATSVSWTPPHSLFDQASVRNLEKGNGSITVDTFSGTTKIGSKNIGFTLTLNASQKPTMTSATFSEATTAPVNIASVIGAYVQGQTTLNYTVNGAAGILGSTIASYSIQVGDLEVDTATPTGKTSPITNSGTVAVKVSVIDSRGRASNVWTTNITVLAWAPPKITTLDVQRAKADGTLDPAGSYLRIVLAGTVSSLLVANAQKNTLTYKTDTRVVDASTWTSKRNTAAGAVTSVSVTYVISPYVETGSFDVRTLITDRFATTTVLRSISVAVVSLMLGSNVASIGKFWERGTLDIGGDVYSTGNYYTQKGGFNHGPTAMRDSIYGSPSVIGDQVKLANLMPVWFNTDHGWWESYYVSTGASGLAVRGISVNADNGWYPIWDGPRIHAFGTQVQASLNTYVGNWTGGMTKGDSSHGAILSGNQLQVKLAGRYEAFVRAVAQPGNGTANFHFRLLNDAANVVVDSLDGGAVVLSADRATRYETLWPDQMAHKNQRFALFTHAGSLAMNLYGDPGGIFTVKYISPPFDRQ